MSLTRIRREIEQERVSAAWEAATAALLRRDPESDRLYDRAMKISRLRSVAPRPLEVRS